MYDMKVFFIRYNGIVFLILFCYCIVWFNNIGVCIKEIFIVFKKGKKIKIIWYIKEVFKIIRYKYW